jgi:aspartate aminotransferase-like enzyme
LPTSRKYPDYVHLVDSVNSLSATVECGALGIDVLLAGTKALALPPGLTVFTCSPAALIKPRP